jgi:chromosome segregation ATPase
MKRRLLEQSLRGEWSGRAALEYGSASANCANNLENLGAALDDAHYALTRFASQLESAQHTADRIAGELGECRAELTAAENRAARASESVAQARAQRDAASSPHDRAVRDSALSSAQSSLQRRQVTVDELAARAAMLIEAAKANKSEYEAAVNALRSALSAAHTYAPAQSKRSASPGDLVGGPPSPGIDDIVRPLVEPGAF